MGYKDKREQRAYNVWWWNCSPGKEKRLAHIREYKRRKRLRTILNSTDYFKCQYYNCRMSKKACIGRQESRWKRFGDFQDDWCRNECKQKEEIKK